MSPERVLHVHLDDATRVRAEAGRSNLANRIAAAVAPAGIRLAFHGTSEAEQVQALTRPGWTLLYRQEPLGPRSLCLRRAYHYPFWTIEATSGRWDFDVVRAAFDPASVDPDTARRFVRRMRERIFGSPAVTREGFAFMPLQGRLLAHRSFQSMSPVEMIEATLASDPRPIRAILHPRETYAAPEIEALDALQRRFPRFRLVREDGAALLAACDHVVTQNSAMALAGFFLGKRAVLFAGIDFHHAAHSVPRDGLAAAFAALDGPEPPLERYPHWFYKDHTINAGAPDAEDRIRARLRRHGIAL